MRLRRLSRSASALALLVGLITGCTAAPRGGATPQPSGTALILRYASKYQLPPEYAEWQRPYQESLERYLMDHIPKGLEAPPPDATFVRFLRPDEIDTVLGQCLADQGFPVAISLDGAMDFGDYPADQTPALLAADFRCQVRYPVDPRYLQKLSPEKIRVVYDYLVNELTPCVIREGYAVDTGRIPTFETFLAHYDVTAWSPYAAVKPSTTVTDSEWEAEWKRINKACPQNPPDDRLFPGGK